MTEIAPTGGIDALTLRGIFPGSFGLVLVKAAVSTIALGSLAINNVLAFNGTKADFIQFDIQNLSNGVGAQSGYSATADTGTSTTLFAWMGINDSGTPLISPYNIGGALDTSFIGAGNDMYLWNSSTTKDMIFALGKVASPYFDEFLRIKRSNNSIIATVPGGLTSIQAATQDGVQLLGRAGGIGSFVGTLTPSILSASRTYLLPDASITLAGSTSALINGQVVVGGAGGILSGSTALTYSGSLFTLNQSGAALAAGSAGTIVQIAAAGATRVLVDSFGTGIFSSFAGRSARGTSAAPTALQLGDEITHVSAFGYGATGYSASPRGFISIFAAENWTDTAQGTRIGFQTTAPGGVVTSEKLRIFGDGGISIGGTYTTSPGPGGLLVTGVGGIRDIQAATQDGIQIIGRAGGTSSFVASITPTTLTASRTYTLPDADITLSGSTGALTAGQVIVGQAGGLLGGSTSLTFTGGLLSVVGSASVGQGTITVAAPNYAGTATWNNAAVTFTGLSFNAIDTSSNAASMLMNLQLGGSTRFQVLKTGEVGYSVAPTVGGGLIQLASGTTIANGILLGDVGIFRNAANALTINASGGTTINGGTLFQNGSANIAATYNGTLYLSASEAGSIHRLYVGDGSGWNFRIASRTGSVTTDRYTFNDSGALGIFAAVNSGRYLLISQNTSAGTSAWGGSVTRNDGAVELGTFAYSSGYTGGAICGITPANYVGLFGQGAGHLGTFINNLTSTPIIFGTANAERMRILAGGGISVGATGLQGSEIARFAGGTIATPTATDVLIGGGQISTGGGITANVTPTALSGNLISIYGISTYAPGAASSAAYVAGWFRSMSSVASNGGTILGSFTQGGLLAGATGTYASVLSAIFESRNSSAGTVTQLTGIQINQAINSGGGTVNTNVAIDILAQTVGTTNFSIRTSTGIVQIGDATDATSSTVGSVTMAGGLAVAKSAFVGGLLSATTGLRCAVVGGGVSIKEGTNATMGVATLVAGTVTVSTTKVTALSRIYTTRQTVSGTTTNSADVTARTPGTSFTLTSGSALDTSTVAWFLVEPAP